MKYQYQESAILELKESIPRKYQIIKTVIGFCNGNGGRLVIGVADDGSLRGVSEESIEETLETIESSILQACEPPILVRTSLTFEVSRGVTRSAPSTVGVLSLNNLRSPTISSCLGWDFHTSGKDLAG